MPKFKAAHPNRKMSGWDIVAAKVNSSDRKLVYDAAFRFDLNARLVPYDRTRLSSADYDSWQSNVEARNARDGREPFNPDAEAELKKFLDAHEGIVHVDGWQMLAIKNCPLLRQHGYTTKDVSRKRTTLEQQALKRQR